MARPKKIVESPVENTSENLVETTVPNILFVMERDTNKIIKIDANKEKDWMTKYKHRTGVEFN